ncbi:hypothetical protein K1719_038960 [Acacia pycnantha]|nr:hypothetical protein K1719_046264 [Acacia pycnantha]KAI9079121.1 hypothetical protein K1719_038960 [Acacia pycnantha]
MGASISSLRNSMSKLPSISDLFLLHILISYKFLSDLLCLVYERVLLDVDSASSIHNIYAYLTGLLLALVELKYQALNTSPFNDHPAVMLLFLIAITVYVMALFVLRSNHQINAMMIWVCHICGSLACELLLLLLVSPMWSFIINLSSLLLLLTFLFSYHFFFQPPQSEEGQATQGTDQAATNPNP